MKIYEAFRFRHLMVVFVGLLFAAPSWAQQKVFVGPCEGMDVEERVRFAICELMKSGAVEEGYSVVNSSEEADFALKSSTLALGSSYTITMSKIQGARSLKSATLKAASVDEIDQVIPRLVRSVVSGKDLRSDTRVGEVTETEARFRTRRKESRVQHTYGLGFSSAPVVDTGMMYDLLLGWGIDWTQFRFKMEGDFSLSTHGFDAFFWTFGGGGNIYFSDRETSPYLGFKVGVAVAKIPSTSFLSSIQSGPLGGLAVGLEGFRNHDASGFIQLKMDMQLSSSEAHGMPVLWGLQGGINY